MPISSRDFFTLKLDRASARALEITPGPAPYAIDGAKCIANHVDGPVPADHAVGRCRSALSWIMIR